jgi:major vault protein
MKTFEAEAGDLLPPGKYAAGQEVFLTDRDGYFIPTEELEVVGEIAPVPIDDRQGLYVRDIATGRIDVIEGPASFLPDPTKVAVIGPARSVTIPSGFAVLVTSQSKRQVVRGPTTRVLAMGEELEALRLSTGRPKSAEKRIETRFLQTSGNKVSDLVRVKTRDHNDLEVTLSYRVSFVNEEERWFNVEDYVALLCDHLGSLARAAARRSTLEQMQQDGVEILRSAVLGDRKENTPRPGRYFEENGMLVYDVEVLEIRILDAQLEEILGRAQHNAILADVTKREEALQRGILASKLETLQERVRFEEGQRVLSAAEIASRVAADREEKLGLARNEADALLVSHAAKHDVAEREAELARRAFESKVAGFERQMGALAPELVATLKTLGHQHLAAELSRNVSPLAILGGESVGDVVERLIGSLPMGNGHTVRDALPAKPAKR